MKNRLLVAVMVPLICLLAIGIAYDLHNAAPVSAENTLQSDALAVADTYITQHTELTTFKTQLYRVRDGWALVEVIPTAGTTDHALMVLQQTGNNWRVVLGPGTAFPPELLSAHQIPASLFEQ